MRIGLTGGIGSGKSTVASMLAKLGAALVDTDRIARELTLAGGAALPSLAATFGPDVIGADGALDRAAVRALVFSDPAAKQRLEAVLHPLIDEQAQRLAGAAAGQAVVFDVPLLAETGRWRARLDRVLVVDCREATQIERVIARSGWSRDTVQRVIAQQAPRALRRAIADAVVFNDGLALDALELAVTKLYNHWSSGRARL
jgi:dephospho-CoA kinase